MIAIRAAKVALVAAAALLREPCHLRQPDRHRKDERPLALGTGQAGSKSQH
jgi:hypothetical protein